MYMYYVNILLVCVVDHNQNGMHMYMYYVNILLVCVVGYNQNGMYMYMYYVNILLVRVWWVITRMGCIRICIM